MQKTRNARFIDGAALAARTVSVLVLANAPLLAATPPPVATDPWTRGINVMQTFFTGVFARGVSLIAIVIGGAMFAMDESGGSKKKVGGMIFGTGLMLLAAQFLNWIFGTTL